MQSHLGELLARDSEFLSTTFVNVGRPMQGCVGVRLAQQMACHEGESLGFMCAFCSNQVKLDQVPCDQGCDLLCG